MLYRAANFNLSKNQINEKADTKTCFPFRMGNVHVAGPNEAIVISGGCGGGSSKRYISECDFIKIGFIFSCRRWMGMAMDASLRGAENLS